jgi:hypothetical protein
MGCEEKSMRCLKILYSWVGILLFLVCVGSAVTDAVAWDLKSDTWVAWDGLGRKLPGYAEAGPPRANRTVGIFYHLWFGPHGTDGPYDVTLITGGYTGNPNDLEDLQWGPPWKPHHWGEPELGYYLSDDAYAIRKHCQMLVDAGVDTLIYDCSNEYTYYSNYMLLAGIYQQIRDQGGKTPQFCFMLSTGLDDTNFLAETLYDEFYSHNYYPDLWFMWKGKPLICTHPDGLRPEVQAFYNFRSMINSYGSGQPGYQTWAWTDYWPQDYGWDEDPNIPECVVVMPAVAPMVNVGRSHYNQVQPDMDNLNTEQGLYFTQNWERALQLDPEFVYLYGWNEWTASLFVYPNIGPQDYHYFLGRRLQDGDIWFADSYNHEFSKCCEPMKGGHTDNYYYQMVTGIRRYKGVRPLEVSGPATTIGIDGSFSDWDGVQPEYRDTIGDTMHRNHPGWGSAGGLVNTTGRNDFVAMKVAHDADNIYFYAQTSEDITNYTDPYWMLLFIDADNDNTTGWEGYDYLVNYGINSTTSTMVMRSTGGWNWTYWKLGWYQVAGNKMEMRISRADLGLTDYLAFNFHWADNLQQPDDVMEFAVSGDSAPNRRFMYRYVAGDNPPLQVSAPADRTVPRGSTVQFNVSASGGEPPYTHYRWRKDGNDLGLTGPVLILVNVRPADVGGYSCQVIDSAANAAVSASAALTLAAAGDFDVDGDVDLEDFGHLQECMSGSGRPQTDPDCRVADLDDDNDVDLADFNILADCMSGTNLPANPACDD